MSDDAFDWSQWHVLDPNGGPATIEQVTYPAGVTPWAVLEDLVYVDTDVNHWETP